MDIREQVKEVIINKGGIAKSADFVAAGIRAVDVVNLCNAGFLNRVRHGYYELAEKSAVSEEQLLATLVPKGVVCVESALFHYGYSDFAPRKWSIAIPRSMSRTKLNVDVLALQPYYVQAELYDLGKTTDDFDGVTLPVYDRERTICDCFKYRSKLDNEIFNKALNAYANDTKKNLNNLSAYAKKLRVYKKVTELMEVYCLMADIAASVLARLKNKAAESGRSYQLCLQLFCQEEFLRRLEKSKYAENLVLKGGLFIYSLTDFDSRVTVDVDFLLRQMPNTPEQLKTVLEEIIATPTGNDFITFEIKNVAPIAVAKKYAGIGASIVARIKNTKTPFNIDFGVGDVIVPKQENRKIPTQLSDFDAPTVNTYSLETTIAEKIDAILSLMEFSSRMKDYYDIYYLANKFDFDGTTLTEALKKTFENRGHSFTVEQFEQVMGFDRDGAMQKKWKAFTRKIDTKTDDYSTVLKTIKEFLTEPFVAAVENKEFIQQWSAYSGKWM